MKIVIDIDEEIYKCFIDDWLKSPEILRAVRKGTPLPKGHGRLIDESKITKCYMPVNKFDVRGIKTDAPTIIEADKEGE